MSRLAIVKYTLTFLSLLTCSILSSKLKIGLVNHRVGWETGGMFRSKDQRSTIHNWQAVRGGISQGRLLRPMILSILPSDLGSGMQHTYSKFGEGSTRHQQCPAAWAVPAGWGKGSSSHSVLLQPHPEHGSSCNHTGIDRPNYEQLWKGKVLRVQDVLVQPSSRVSLGTDPLRKRRNDWGDKLWKN